MPVTPAPTFYKMQWSEDGKPMSGDAHLYFDQQGQTIEQITNQFNTGIVVTPKTTAEIAALEPTAPIGTTWFNTTLAKLQVKVAAGTIETVTST